MAAQENQANQTEQPDRPYPKSVIMAVCFFLAGSFVLSVWQVRTRLHIPQLSLGDGQSIEEISNSLLDTNDDQLQLQDSDQDGLNDYEELKVYGTSPFIADTDSDGDSDAQEVSSGTDPNCAKGKSCFAASTTETGPTQSNKFATTEVQDLMNDPAALRRLLIAAGADAELVTKLDDQSLQVLAQQAFQDLSGPTQEKVEVLQGKNITQIRAMLKSFGMKDEDLNALSDEEIQQLYDQAVKEIQVPKS